MKSLIASLDVNPPSREAFVHFWEAQMADGHVGSDIKELVRRRLVEIDRLAAQSSLPDDVSALRPHGCTGATGAALDYTDHFSLHYQAIPDAVWEALEAEFDAPQLTELSWTIAVLRGMHRVGAALG